MIGGVKHPNLAVPIGTYTGWNLRREGFAEGAQCGGTGSFIPFAMDRAERLAAGDTRPSLEERYPTAEAYAGLVSEAADTLVKDRLLLQEDADRIVELARRATASARTEP